MRASTELAGFYRATENYGPSELLLDAMPYVKSHRLAYDLGCGAGRDTRYLSAEFERVNAVDVTDESYEHVSGLALPNVDVSKMLLQDLVFQDSVDLVNAQKVLMYLYYDDVSYLLQRVQRALDPGGVFVGQLSGLNDWRKKYRGFSTYSPDRARKLFDGLRVEKFEEEEKDAECSQGLQHFHTIHFIAAKT